MTCNFSFYAQCICKMLVNRKSTLLVLDQFECSWLEMVARNTARFIATALMNGVMLVVNAQSSRGRMNEGVSFFFFRFLL